MARRDSTMWYKDEFQGRILLATHTYVSWEKQTMKVNILNPCNTSYNILYFMIFLQCIVADGSDKILVIVRNAVACKIVEAKRSRLKDGLKVIISNYQKNNGVIMTNEKSSAEIDDTVRKHQ